MPDKLPIPSDAEVAQALVTIRNACHHRAWNAGWWHDPKTGNKIQRPVPECLMLMVSELGEAMEAHRKNLMDDHLPHRKGVDVEIADVIIRAFDFIGGFGIDVGVVVEKMFYNDTRADHKPENRVKAGGKAY